MAVNNKGRNFLSDLKLYSDFLRYREDLGRYETWDEAVEEVINTHRVKYQGIEELTPHLNFAEQKYKEKYVLAAQRNLQFRGEDIFRHEFRIFNCVGRETEFITSVGIKSFYDFKDGDEITVLTHKGRWRKAKVKNYGKQPLNKITFKYISTEQTVRATSNHRWLLSDGSQTTDLKIDGRLIKPVNVADFDYSSASPMERLYWCYGYIYGDGSKIMDKKGVHKYSMVRLCGDKVKYSYRFKEMGFPSSNETSLKGDLFFYTGKYLKELPNVEMDGIELTKAFVNGYLNADGCKDNNKHGRQYKGIQATGEESIDFLRKNLSLAGYYIYREVDKTHVKTNYGERSAKTVEFGITDSIGSKYNSGYKVSKIEKDVEEEVWCLEVEEDNSFVLKNGVVTGNCLTLFADKSSFFGNAFYLLLCGCGLASI